MQNNLEGGLTPEKKEKENYIVLAWGWESLGMDQDAESARISGIPAKMELRPYPSLVSRDGFLFKGKERKGGRTEEPLMARKEDGAMVHLTLSDVIGYNAKTLLSLAASGSEKLTLPLTIPKATNNPITESSVEKP